MCIWKGILRRIKWNFYLDAALTVPPFEQIKNQLAGSGIDVVMIDMRSEEVGKLMSFNGFKSLPYKKRLEFIFTARLLELSPGDKLLDAAGGKSPYLDFARSYFGINDVYLSDHIYTGISIHEGLTIVGGAVDSINLPDGSINKIACHHAFEHFKKDTDINFIRTISRLLANKGLACITPLFISDQYVECWNINHPNTFDSNANLLIDKSASLPGGDDDGHFARIYDIAAFTKRIITPVKETRLRAEIYELRLDNKIVPDMRKEFGSKLNAPMRALLIRKS